MSIYAVLKDKNPDPLHKRIFKTNITEIKTGNTTGKTVADELEFKKGKVFSSFLNDKFNIGWMKYVINKDTVFIDSLTEAEVHYFQVTASFKDEDKQETKLICKIENEIIEGEIKISKNDKLKKQFEFLGIEKATRMKDKNKK